MTRASTRAQTPGLRGIGAAIAGWLCVYISMGGAAGFLLATHHAPFRLFADGFHPPPYCLPEKSLFGAIESRCESGIINLLWFLAVGLPRLIIACTGWAMMLTAHPQQWGIDRLDTKAALGSLDLAAIVLIGFYALGVNYWRKRRMWRALALGVAGPISLGVFIFQQYPD